MSFALAVSAFSLALILPKRAPYRSLLPHDFHSRGVPTLVDLPMNEDQTVLLGGNTTQFQGAPSWRSIAGMDPAKPSSGLTKLARTQPNLFPQNLIFLFESADAATLVPCPSSMHLKRQGISGQLTSCKQIKALSTAQAPQWKSWPVTPSTWLAVYRLDSPTFPGKEAISFSPTAQIRSFEDTGGSSPPLRLQTILYENETSAFIASGDNVYPADILRKIRSLKAPREAMFFVSIALSIALASLAILSIWQGEATWRRLSFLGFLAILTQLIALNSLQPYFSGNDETAHYVMALDVQLDQSIETVENREQIRKVAMEQARQLMYAEDFFLLHPVLPLARGWCLHGVLSRSPNDCGKSDRPAEFYDDYLNSNLFDATQPRQFLANVRIQNTILLLLIIAAYSVLLTEKMRAAYLGVLTFYGSAFAAVNSLTNDIITYITGISLLGAQALALSSANPARKIVGFLLAILFAYTYRDADISMKAAWLAFTPTFFLVILGLKKYQNETPLEEVKCKGGVAIASGLLLFLCGLTAFSIARRFIAHIPTALMQPLPFLEELTQYVGHVGKANFTEAITAITNVSKTAFGNFLWSHTTYPSALSLLLLLLFLGFSWFAFGFLWQARKMRGIVFVGLLLLQFLMFGMIVDSLAEMYRENLYGQWTYLVFRFYAGLLPAVFLPTLLGICFLFQKTSFLRFFLIFLSSWVIFNAAHFYPSFFIAASF